MSESCPIPPEKTPAAVFEISDFVDLLAGTPLPLEVGHLEVGEEGRLARRDTAAPLRFSFAYGGFAFDCAIDRGDEGRIEVSATLGSLPYTAQSPWGRAFLLRLMVRAAQLPSGRLALSEDGIFSLSMSKATPRPCTAVAVMSVVAALVLEFKPYGDVLRPTVEPVS